MTTRHTIAWLIPCFNEGLAIGDVVRDIKRECPEGAIYVYDNRSTDDTGDEAFRAGACVRKVHNRGKGNVVRQMFFDVEADIYIMLDGDGTYDVSSWRALVQPVLNREAEMVVGARLQNFQHKSFRRFHLFGNRVISSMLAWIFGTHVRDVLSGYRAFSRTFVKSVGLDSSGFEIETELTVKAIEHRFHVVEIDFPYRSRPPGSNSKLKTFEDGMIILLTILRLFKDHKPLSFGCIVSGFSAIGGLFSYALGWDHAGSAFWNAVPVALFGGLILNSISQRTREINQIVIKTSDVTTVKEHSNAESGVPWQKSA